MHGSTLSDANAPVVLTSGEPSGVGPELAWAAWGALKDEMVFAFVGDPRSLPSACIWEAIDHPKDAAAVMSRALPVLVAPCPAPIVAGRLEPANASTVVAWIERAIALVQAGDAAALTTGPIHKKVLQDGAGFAFPGHTEFLSHLAGGATPVMMLSCDALSVVPVTIHIALKDVPGALTPELLTETLEIVDLAMQRDFAIASPRIAVAGLNPHAGESGAMGHEELEFIVDVVADLAARGLNVTGPHPADTMFHADARAKYDVAVAMYHDQALIPIKTLDFHGGVNVTLGLPFIRTSPDHGTALDIAGKGIANPGSTIAALRKAAALARARGA